LLRNFKLIVNCGDGDIDRAPPLQLYYFFVIIHFYQVLHCDGGLLLVLMWFIPCPSVKWIKNKHQAPINTRYTRFPQKQGNIDIWWF